MDGWMDGWADGRVEGWVGGQVGEAVCLKGYQRACVKGQATAAVESGTINVLPRMTSKYRGPAAGRPLAGVRGQRPWSSETKCGFKNTVYTWKMNKFT
eukprot:365803-Chlamydomonas_euryale.AAC.10